MCKLLILQGHEVPKMPLCRVHRTPIVHGVGEDKANINTGRPKSQLGFGCAVGILNPILTSDSLGY
jgi:hypothetical protein